MREVLGHEVLSGAAGSSRSPNRQGYDVTDPRNLSIDELRAENARLRARIHQVASDGQRERASIESDLARLRRLLAEAREYTRDWEVTWTTDPPSQKPYGWWAYTSMVNCAGAAALLDRAVTAESAVRELAGVLHQAYVSADTRELQLAIREILKRYDTDPED